MCQEFENRLADFTHNYNKQHDSNVLDWMASLVIRVPKLASASLTRLAEKGLILISDLETAV